MKNGEKMKKHHDEGAQHLSFFASPVEKEIPLQDP